MAGISNWALVSSIQSEIQREQNDLKYVDENLKRLTGRDFNEPRGDRRIRVVSGVREDDPQPKPRYPKGVFARLGAPVLEGGVEPRVRRVREVSEENGEPPKKKPLVASSVARPTFDGKTRTEAAAELTKDRASRDRNRRMFGSLLGTLQRFKSEEAKLKDKDDKRAKVEKKLEEKGRAEKELLRKERIDLINQRKERQARIHRLNIKMARVKEHEAWEKYQRQLQKFIRTKSQPKIFWVPKILSSRCTQLLSATKENIENELEEERLRLKKELDELLGERYHRDEADEKIEEEEFAEEGFGRELDKEPFRGGLGNIHNFNNGSNVDNFETEEGELINEESELWLSGKKRQNPERFVIQVESMSKEPTRRVEIVTVAAPKARRVKEEHVDKNARMKERLQMESEKENLTNGKQLESEQVVRMASFKITESDIGKDKIKEKERKKQEKIRSKEKEKLRSSTKGSSQRIVIEGSESLNNEKVNEKISHEKQRELPADKETLNKESDRITLKSKRKNENREKKEERESNDSDNEIEAPNEASVISQKSRSGKEEKQKLPLRDDKEAGEKEKRQLQVENDDNENEKLGEKEKRQRMREGKDAIEKERSLSNKEENNVEVKEKRKETDDKEKKISQKGGDTKEKMHSLKEGKNNVERERKISQKEGSDSSEKEKRQSVREGKEATEKEKRQSHRDSKDSTGREKEFSQKHRDATEHEKRRSLKDRVEAEKEKSKDAQSYEMEKEKRHSQDAKDSSRSSKVDKGKNRKRKAVEESTEYEEVDAEEIWSEDLSHISLPLEPEPAVTEVVVQRVPVREEGQDDDDDDDHDEMEVESILIPVSQIKKDKTVWDPLPIHRPIAIKMEKDASPIPEKQSEKDAGKTRSDSESSSESSDSEGSSSESEESSEEEASSNSSDSSSASDDEKHGKKRNESKKKRQGVKDERDRVAKVKGRRSVKRKAESSSSSSEDDSGTSSSSDSDESSSDEERDDKRASSHSSKDNKKSSYKESHKGKSYAKDASSLDKEKVRKGSKILEKDELKKIMDKEAERLRERIIRGVEGRSKSNERGRKDKRGSKSTERVRERSRERKKAHK